MSQFDQEASLTLKDRINFPYILANQILSFQKASASIDYDEQQVQDIIKGFVHALPTTWKDKAFTDQIKDASKEREIDNRPKFCGISASKIFCEIHKIEVTKKVTIIDYYKVYQACMDLLDRMKMLSNIHRVEELEDIDFDKPNESAFLESNLPSE